jgi:glycosidase
VNLIKDANKNWPNQRYGTFLTNHDQTRIMDALGNDMAMMKLAATAYLTSTGLPFIYYGEEIGMLGTKPDEQIRTPMQWSGDSKGGFSTGTPWEPLNPDVAKVNVQTQDSDSTSLLNLYRKLIQIRRTTPSVAQGDYTPLNSNYYKVATYLRHTENSDVLVVLNMSDQPITDLKLDIDKSSLASGQYSPTLLMSLDGTSPALAPLTAQANGAIVGYAPLANIPATSGYIIKLK